MKKLIKMIIGILMSAVVMQAGAAEMQADDYISKLKDNPGLLECYYNLGVKLANVAILAGAPLSPQMVKEVTENACSHYLKNQNQNLTDET
jgi:demethoxyubiquinone hydroxylase (CLK1/Coq7/Cat5 family)